MINTIIEVIILIHIINYFRKDWNKPSPSKVVYDERNEDDRRELEMIFGY